MNRRGTVLLVDDEPHIRRDLGENLAVAGYAVHKAGSSDEARKILLSESPDYAIVDLIIDHTSRFGGIGVINLVKRLCPKTKVVVLSAYSPEDTRPELDVEIDGFVSKGGPGNYIVAILEKLDELEHCRPVKRCFVIMPFSSSTTCTGDEWTEVFEEVIKPAVEQAGFGYECSRSEALAGDNIIEHMLDQLNRADLVVADLTDRNPNVFYELGVRHALRGGTILIAQNLDDIPFDLRAYATQLYDWKRRQGREEFKQRVRAIIEKIEREPERAQSPVRKYLHP